MRLSRLVGLVLTLATLLAALGAPEEAHAVDIRVRGEGKIFADVQAAGTTLQVAGALRDEFGRSLPFRDLELSVMNVHSQRSALRSVKLTTDIQGRFQLQQDLDPGDYAVTMRFIGTEHLAGDDLVSQVSLNAQPPRVDIHIPRLVAGQSQPANLRVRASVAGIGVSGAALVAVNGKSVETIELDHYGRGALDVVKHLDPGENLVEVSLPATARRPEATDVARTRFSRSPILTATASASHRRLERGLAVRGEVKDELGPLTSGSVLITFERVGFAEGDDAPRLPDAAKHRAEVELGEGGVFEGFISGQIVRDGQWRAHVVYQPDAGKSLETLTQVVTFDQSSSRFFLNLLGALAILLGVGVLVVRLSTIDFAALLARLGRKDDDGVIAPDFAESEPIVIEALEDGSGVEPVAHDRLAGLIWDTWRAAPVGSAQLEFSQGGRVVYQTTSALDGTFRTDSLGAGAWHLDVIAPGFSRGTLDFELPHGGEYSRFRIGLTAVPLKIRRYYQSWVRRTHGDDLWGRLSPRQIEATIWSAFDVASVAVEDSRGREQLRQSIEALLADDGAGVGADPEELLLAMTEIVEEAYFSSRIYDEQLWQVLVQITTQLDARKEVP